MTDSAVAKLISEAEQAVEAYSPLCWIRHRYTRWVDAGKGKLEREGRIVGDYIIQERRCLRCNRLERRMVKAQT